MKTNDTGIAGDAPVDPLTQCRHDIARVDAVVAALLDERSRLMRKFDEIIHATRGAGPDHDERCA